MATDLIEVGNDEKYLDETIRTSYYFSGGEWGVILSEREGSFVKNIDFRLLTFPDVKQAANFISQALVGDPLCTFMLPFRKSRVKTLYKFFRAYGEVNIKNNRDYES